MPRPPAGQKQRAYGYVRVSTEEQVKEGISLEWQKRKLEAWAEVKDLNLVEVITDEGFSGKDLNRPGLQRLLELCQDEDTEALIVYKLDRLTRKTRDLLHLVEERFEVGNTRLLSITEEIDTETPMGKFFLTMTGAMAQMERELIAERTKAAFSHKKEQGHSMGLIPFGFQRAEGILSPNSDEQKVIRRMKRWRKQGLSFREIAQRLNEKGILPRRQKTQWHASSVRLILQRKRGFPHQTLQEPD